MKRKLNKTQRKRLTSIISGGVFFAFGIIFSVFKLDIISAVSFVMSGICAGAMCVIRAVSGITRGSFFDENTLMTIAAIGAVVIGEYPECAAVMILYQVGELFQSLAVGRSRRAIAELSKLCPDTAEVLRDGNFITVSASVVSANEIVRIAPGQRIPCDCVIVEGRTSVDTSPVTGESLPREAEAGDELFSGCVNIDGLVSCRVLRPASESAASRILKLTEQASDRKTAAETFITRFAKIYTPIVCLIAAFTAFIVPLILLPFGGNYLAHLAAWGKKSLSMLVISCPCALVISVPLSYFCGMGRASRSGILIKGSIFIDALSKANVAVFDKTGTLTCGKLKVSSVEAEDKNKIMTLAASAEAMSSHPIARAVCEAFTGELLPVAEVTEKAGRGVEVTLLDGRSVKVLKPEEATSATAVDVYENSAHIGRILFSDEVKSQSKDAIARLKKLGIKKAIILTGDADAEAKRIKDLVGADKAYSRLLPEDKLKHIEALCGDACVMYAGDGINDSPALARSDVGVAMGALGTDAAIEAADIVLMDSNPIRLAEAMAIAKKTTATVKANIAIALGVKILVLILALLGITGMWSAILADVGMCILCVTNAMRLLALK